MLPRPKAAFQDRNYHSIEYSMKKSLPILIFTAVSVAGILCSDLPSSAAADNGSYSWVDRRGHIIYGTKPPDGAAEVKKLNTRALSRYSSEKVLTRLGWKAHAKANSGQGKAETLPIDSAPADLQGEGVSVKYNEQHQVIACSVQVKNAGAIPAREISVAFEFADGTLVPGVGPDGIDPDAMFEYKVPDELLPLTIKQKKNESPEADESPRVIIHGAEVH